MTPYRALALAAIFAAGACSKKEGASAPAPADSASTTAIHQAPVEATASGKEMTPAELEKAKALQEPFANDYGPATVDVSGYPADAQAGYKALLAKCTVCHNAARPLNSEFVETAGKDAGEREKSLAALKTASPEVFKDPHVWKAEAGIWQRYVKRMMSKPGCEVTPDEGKVIWAFLAHDSRERKIGKNAASWKAHRTKLLADFKAKHPERYETLYSR